MSSGDFIEIESGDTLAVIKIEMEDINLDNKDDGDFQTDCGNPICEEETERNKSERMVLQESKSGKKIGHRRIHSDGGVSYKNINTLQIMESVQLGIQRSIGSLAFQPERDVLMVDFMTVECTSFTSENSDILSDKPEFVFKTYAPVAFKHLRDLFGIKAEDFVASFQSPLLELPNPGASGSVFYLTQNDDFITKTVQHREAEFLQKLLPGYFLNLSQNPRTLLPKFFGLYCYKRNTTNVRLLVMNNVLPSNIKIHKKYDLKGSTFKRKASKTELRKSSPTYKDLNFMEHHPEGIFLNAEVYKNLVKTIQRDCRVLESFQIIDYSLLIGVHYVNKAEQKYVSGETLKKENSVPEEKGNIPSGDGHFTPYEAEIDSQSSETQGKFENTNSQFTEVPKDAKENKEPCENNKYTNITGIPAVQADGKKILLFIGIIDILQSYRLKKRVEHFWKSMLHSGDEISVHNPAFYARRFNEFMTNKVFKCLPSSPKNKRKNVSAFQPDDKVFQD